jgi:hypothetical protein
MWTQSFFFFPLCFFVGKEYAVKVRDAQGGEISFEGISSSTDTLQVRMGGGRVETLRFPPTDVEVLSCCLVDSVANNSTMIRPKYVKLNPVGFDRDEISSWIPYLSDASGQLALYGALKDGFQTRESPFRSEKVDELLELLSVAGPEWQRHPLADRITRTIHDLKISMAAWEHKVPVQDLRKRYDAAHGITSPEDALAAKMKEEHDKRTNGRRPPSTSSAKGPRDTKQTSPATQCTHCWKFWHTSASCFEKQAGKPALPKPAGAGFWNGAPVRTC